MRFSFNQILFVIGAGLGLGAVAYGGSMAWARLSPPKAVMLDPQAGCDLNRDSCRARLPGGGELRLTIRPRPIPFAQPIALEVEIAGREAESVEADIGNLDMYMGNNRRTLAPDGAHRHTGKTMLAVCARERMRWRVTVIARSGREIYSVPFGFETRSAPP